jgi:hypothetical protein
MENTKQVKKYFVVKLDRVLGSQALEYIDCFDSMLEASKALNEYRLAFGSKIKLDILIKTETYLLKGEL